MNSLPFSSEDCSSQEDGKKSGNGIETNAGPLSMHSETRLPCDVAPKRPPRRGSQSMETENMEQKKAFDYTVRREISVERIKAPPTKPVRRGSCESQEMIEEMIHTTSNKVKTQRKSAPSIMRSGKSNIIIMNPNSSTSIEGPRHGYPQYNSIVRSSRTVRYFQQPQNQRSSGFSVAAAYGFTDPRYLSTNKNKSIMFEFDDDNDIKKSRQYSSRVGETSILGNDGLGSSKNMKTTGGHVSILRNHSLESRKNIVNTGAA